MATDGPNLRVPGDVPAFLGDRRPLQVRRVPNDDGGHDQIQPACAVTLVSVTGRSNPQPANYGH